MHSLSPQQKSIKIQYINQICICIYLFVSSIYPRGGHSGSKLRRSVQTSLSQPQIPTPPGRSPDVPKQTVRQNLSSRYWACPGISVQWDMPNTSLEGANLGEFLKCPNHLNWLLFMDSYFLVLSMYRSMQGKKRKWYKGKNRKAVREDTNILAILSSG